jgi:hypothetical protein
MKESLEMMTRHYVLNAECGRYHLEGHSTGGKLGAYTGRYIDVEGRYPYARRWIESYEASQKEYPEFEQELLQSLNPAARGTFEEPLFRGRFFDTSPKSCWDFGPPSPENACRGRYNAEGSHALYLCSSRTGVMRELNYPKTKRRLWIQRFRMLPQLRMADARQLPIDSPAAAVFYFIESGRDRLTDSPRLGQRLGLVIGQKYDGLLVPGVRGNEILPMVKGDSGELYWNAVIFRPDDWWRDLVDSSFEPEEA